jgi:hypothetical protein
MTYGRSIDYNASMCGSKITPTPICFAIVTVTWPLYVYACVSASEARKADKQMRANFFNPAAHVMILPGDEERVVKEKRPLTGEGVFQKLFIDT